MFFFLSLFYITRDWRYKSGKTNSSTWFSVCAVKTKREGGGGGSFVSVGRNHRTAPKFGDCSNPSTISPPLLFISIYIVIECRVPYRRERAATDDRSAQATTTSLYFSVTSSATSRFFFFFFFSLHLDMPHWFHPPRMKSFLPFAYMGELLCVDAAAGS